MIPKARLDAMADGIFSIAMTLLVLDVRFPESFRPESAAAFLAGFSQLQGPFIAYVTSFLVIGGRWLAQARQRGSPEEVSGTYGMWMLIYLFCITAVPFTSLVVGRYVAFAPAIWLYAGNMILSAVIALGLVAFGERRGKAAAASQVATLTLIASALLSIAISFFSPENAMWAYLLNAGVPLARRLWRRAPAT